MASISRDKNGTRRILFVDTNGDRKAIRLGKIAQRGAEAVKFRVEQLLAAKLTGHAIESDTAQWLAGLEPAMAKKLARVGLIPDPEAKPAGTLGAFLEAYTASRKLDMKSGTHGHLVRCKDALIEFLGSGKLLADVTEGDAEEFRRWMKQRQGENTVRRACGRARQFFNAAVKRRLITSNPFASMKSVSVGANAARFHFVTPQEATSVLEACPNNEWRLLFALARYGGLRCPSEPLSLNWTDIDWERERMTVHAPKTEHHEGKGTRIVPIFPELMPFLDQAWDEAEDEAEFVIAGKLRQSIGGPNGWSNANLRTQFQRIVRRAGLTPWGKPFQNCRATRETELAERFPIHVVCQWIGNSQAVARKHYLQVTDEHFRKAVKGGAESGALAAQNQAQHTSAGNGGDSHESSEVIAHRAVVRNSAKQGRTRQNKGITRQGFEP